MTQRLLIRALRLRVEGDTRTASRDLSFEGGLNVLRADNTSGKSTALQAILYALGLEGMLSPTSKIPLAHAMTHSVRLDGIEHTVVRSWVELDIENGAGHAVSLRRAVVDKEIDSRLISVSSVESATDPIGADRRTNHDYFVRMPGAAQRNAGFHHFLADFLNLTLPTVTRLDGSEGPLYLETLFPYFFVEQKHGWSGIQARVPNYFRIKDVSKRSAEFVLGLETFGRILESQRLESALTELEASWHEALRSLATVASAANAVVKSMPVRISAGVSPSQATAVVLDQDEWVPVAEAVGILRARLSAQREEGVPTVREVSAELEARLKEAQTALREKVATLAGVREEQWTTEARLRAIDERVEALDEDLQRHKDAQRLATLGSRHASALLDQHSCPTCHQDVEDGIDITSRAMSIDESARFIESQLRTFRAMRADGSRVLEAVIRHARWLGEEARRLRTEIRDIGDSLTSPSDQYSLSDVRSQMEAEQRLARLVEHRDDFEQARAELVSLAERWEDTRGRLAGIRETALSPHDEVLMERVESSLRTQLEEYGFESISTRDVDIHRDTYRPVNEGYDLGFDLSASDMVRLIWAYLIAIQEVGMSAGSHLGLLVFDEPKQQDAATESYGALLRRCAARGTAGAQIIVATSEPEPSLKHMLSGTDHNLISLSPTEKMLQ